MRLPNDEPPARMSMQTRLRRLTTALLATAFVVTAVVPVVAADRDKDGLRDGFEKKYGITSPVKRDSDGDGVIDSAEDNDGDKLGNLGEQRFGTNPKKKDTDNDGIRDGQEDNDRDGRSNAREQDQRRLPSNLKPTLDDARTNAPNSRRNCLTKAGFSSAKRCWFGLDGSDTRVALLGDSHALMWLPAFERAAKNEGWRLVTLLKGGCTPMLGTMNTGQYQLDRGQSCRTWRKNAYAWINDHPVDLLVIAHADSYQIVDTRGRPITGADKPKTWKAGAKKTLDSLAKPSRVMLMGDIPRNIDNPIKCLFKNPRNISACVSPMETRPKRTIEVALRTAASHKGAQFRTLFGKICTYGPCPLVQGNILMWRDRHHVTATFANKLTPSVRSMLRAGLADAEAAGRR
jgi:hypothetical protein